MADPVPTGMVLLTGGASARFGAPKHLQPHPEGGSWGSHLVDVFTRTLGPGPIRVLGDPVVGRPDLLCVEDPREGPAMALSRWAAAERVATRRWWVVACDQVGWEDLSLASWHQAAQRTDPAGECWVMAEIEGEPQPLGGFLGAALLPAAGRSEERRLLALARSLQAKALPWTAAPFQDLDDPQSFQRWQEERRRA